MLNQKLYAVFGDPILHSKSPQLFNAAFRANGLDAFYTRIRPKSTRDILQIIRTLSLLGANITAPYKEEILQYVDSVSDEARAIGAVNTLVCSNGNISAHNTDHAGVVNSLIEAGVDLPNARCLVIGAGGAARAAIYGLTKTKAQVWVCNRTKEKAQALKGDFEFNLLDWNNFPSEMQFDVVISTLLPEATIPFISNIKYDVLLDASYKPSLISRISQQHGINVISGQRWLLYQAAEAYRLFTGESINPKIMEEGYSISLDKDKLRIAAFPQSLAETIFSRSIDLVVSIQGIDALTIKSIVDDEVSKAFGS